MMGNPERAVLKAPLGEALRAKQERGRREPLDKRQDREFEERRVRIENLLATKNFDGLYEYQLTLDARPEYKGRLRPLIGHFFKRYLEEGDLYAAIELSSMTDVRLDYTPHEHTVQMKVYAKLLKQGHGGPFRVSGLERQTGIKPDFEGRLEPVIQELYATYLKSNEDDPGWSISDLERYTKVPPDYTGRLVSAVQEHYAQQIRTAGYVRNYTSVRDFVEPDWTGALKETVIAKMWESIDALDHRAVERLHLASGLTIETDPSFKTRVQDAYEKKVSDPAGDIDSIWVVENCALSSYYPPDYERLRPLYLKIYLNHLRKGEVSKLDSYHDMRRVMAPERNQEFITAAQEGYQAIFSSRTHKGETYRYLDAKELYRLTSVEMEAGGELLKNILQSYKRNIQTNQFYTAAELGKFCGINTFHPELAPAIQRKCAELLTSGELDTLERLQDEFPELRPDYSGALSGPLRAGARKLLKAGHYDKLTQLQKITGVTPEWEGELRPLVHTRFAIELQNREIDGLGYLMDQSGIQPDFEGTLKERVQEAYASSIKNGRLEMVRRLQTVSGQAPDWNRLAPSVEKAYKRWVTRGSFEPILALAEMSGIKPDYTPFAETIQRKYATYLVDGKDEQLMGMAKQTGIEPDYKGALKGNVINRFRFCLRGFSTPEFRWDSMAKVAEMTGVPLWEEGIWRNASLAYLGEPVLMYFMKKLQDSEEKLVGIRNVARGEIEEILLRGTYGGARPYATVDMIVRIIKVKPDAAKLLNAVTEELAYGRLPPDLLQLLNRCGTKFELQVEQFEKLDLTDPRTAAIVVKYGLPKDAEKRAEVMAFLENKGGWLPLVPELLNVRGPAARPEFCPWEQQLKPLLSDVQDTFEYGLVQGFSADVATNRKGFMEFIKRFGVVNAPRLARTVIHLDVARQRLRAGAHDGAQPMSMDLRLFCNSSGLTDFEIKTVEDADFLLQEIESAVRAIKKQILKDEIPEGIGSPIEQEMFNVIVPRGKSYGDLNDRASLVAEWSTVAKTAKQEGRLKEVRVPEGYTERTYHIRRKVEDGPSLDTLFDELENADQNEEALAARSRRLQELQTKLDAVHAKEPFIKFIGPFQETLVQYADGATQDDLINATAFQPLVARLEMEIEERKKIFDAADPEKEAKKRMGLQQAIKKIELQLERAKKLQQPNGYIEILCREQARLQNEVQAKTEELEAKIEKEPTKAQSLRTAHEGWVAEQGKKILTLAELSREEPLMHKYTSRQADYAQCQGALEALRICYGKDVLNVAGPEARRLMLTLMATESPGHFEAIAQARAETGDVGQMTPKVREAWAKLFEEELLPHFANPEQAHAETRVIPFSSELNALVESTWRITQIRKPLLDEVNHFARKGTTTEKPPSHPFMDTVFEARSVEQAIERVKNPEKANKEEGPVGVPVKFYPVRGVGRILSGDIANACFDKLRRELAKNGFRNLNAVIMAAQEDGEERIIGSFLLIEAKKKSSDDTTVTIRALNPTESAAKEFRCDDVVEAAIDYAKSVTEQRKLHEARMCYETFRGGHATNLTQVTESQMALNKKYRWLEGSELEITQDTQFNGYQIWRKGETRVVWDRTAEQSA